MGKVDVAVNDLSLLRGLWEGRVRTYKQKQRRERERIQQSALARIDQEWQFRIYCKGLKTEERTLLHQYLERSTFKLQPCTDPEEEQSEEQTDPDRLVFRLDGPQWTAFPKELQWMTYLQQWCVTQTRIQTLPENLAQFSRLTTLHLPKNHLREVPPEIGLLSSLLHLNLSYNSLSKVPPELGDCEALKRLELAGNKNLSELPFELSSLKQLEFLDISENVFISVPVCVLRMSALQTLDLSNNRLKDLPQDMDRLDNLVTLLVHKNSLTYLPRSLTNVSSLKMIIVSGDQLNCIPTKLCSNPDIKFVRLYDSPTLQQRRRSEENTRLQEENRRLRWRGQTEPRPETQSSDKECIQAYINTLTDRESVPYSTTKVSISCLL